MNSSARRTRRLLTAALLSAGIAGLFTIGHASAVTPASATVLPAQQTYVTAYDPDGTRTDFPTLIASGPDQREVLLQFKVTGVQAGSMGVTAHLVLTSTAETDVSNLQVRSIATNDWNAPTTDWPNKPALGDVLAGKPTVSGDKVSIDLSSIIHGNGTYSVALVIPTGYSELRFTHATQLMLGWTPPPTTTSMKSTTTTTTAPLGTTAAGDLRAIVVAKPAGSSLSLKAGTFTLSNFQADQTGVNLVKDSLTGAGIDKTVIEMVPNSSTKKNLVPTVTGTSNVLTLMKVTGSPTLSGFTLLGTTQGHSYNGLHVDSATNARVSNVKVKAIPGNDHVPPGETGGLAEVHSTGSVYTNIEIDGASVGASGFSVASDTNLKVNGAYSHDNKYSAGAAIWNTVNTTLTDFKSTNNRIGINLEQDTGTINIVRPVLSGNQEDFYIGSSKTSAKITITDPTFVGTKLHIRIPVKYGAANEGQSKRDIHVIIDGVDKASSVVQWDS